jgi:mono/diheme cytochrome c family protein
MGIGAVGLAIAVLGLAGWMAYLVTQSRVRHRRETPPQNLTPYLTDDELENKRLNRVLVSALIATAVLAIVMPIYYLNESSRQAGAVADFSETAIDRGLEWFTEYKCGNCHGANAGGGGAKFVEARSGITTTWAAPSLNDVMYRYTQDEVRYWLVYGRQGTPMPAWGADGGGPLDDQQIDELIAYLASIQAPQADVVNAVDDNVARALRVLDNADQTVDDAVIAQQAALDALDAAPDQLAAVQTLPDDLKAVMTGAGTCTDESAALYHVACTSPGVDTDRDGLTDRAEATLTDVIARMVDHAPDSDARTALTKTFFALNNQFSTSDGPTPIPDLKEAETVITDMNTVVRDLSLTVQNADRLRPAAQKGLDFLTQVQATQPYAIDFTALADAAFDGDIETARRAAGLFDAYCARCHTAGYSAGMPFTAAAGSGAFGPSLRDGRAELQFPDETAQIAFVTKGSENGKQYGINGIGRGWMPGFGAMLTEEDIMLIVKFERSL